MDNLNGSTLHRTESFKEVVNRTDAENREPPPCRLGDGDTYKEAYFVAGGDSPGPPSEDALRLLQVAEGEEGSRRSHDDNLQALGADMVDQWNGGDAYKEVYSIFADERNFVSDLPLEEVIRLLQLAEGEESVPVGPTITPEAPVIDTTGLRGSIAEGSVSSRHLLAGDTPVVEKIERDVADTTYIPGLSIVGDDRNYVGGEVSLQELSHLLEAAEGKSQNSSESIREGGPLPKTTDVTPALETLDVRNMLIIRDFRNYVGDVSLPDVAGVLGAADEAEFSRTSGFQCHQQTSSNIPEYARLCDACSQINLAYGCSHLNLAMLKKSARMGCTCCQLFDKALEDISQHPQSAPLPKSKPDVTDNTDPTVDTNDSSDESDVGMFQVSAEWARESSITIELARNALIYKVFDSYYKDGRRYNGRDILKFFEFYDYLPGYRSILGRLLESDPASEASFSLIFKWIEECNDEHVKCKQDHNRTKLPRRVIDVWEETPVLVEGGGKCAPYILLSHCWGGEQTLTTTQATLSQRAQGIPIDQFPETFQDAVKITRTLGIQYLWIDSLCIVQDLEEDWVSESSNMNDYYRNGYLTISALYSPHSHHGILNLRQDLPSVQLSSNTNLYIRPRLPDNPEVFRNAPLNNRAWALQERLLSTRVLHYSDKEMFWECQTCSARESSVVVSDTKTDLDTVISSEGEDFKRVLSYIDDDPYSAVNGAFVTWYRLATNYSRRAITFESDKLPAISGLASLIESKVGATYLAGIWKEDIRSLLWLRDMSRPDRKTQKEIDPELPHCPSPSWSWASAKGPIRYRYEEAISSGHDAVIISYNLPNGSAEYPTDRSDGYLVLHARSRSFTYEPVFDKKHKFVGASLYEESTKSSSMLFAGEGYMDCSMDDAHDRNHNIQGTPPRTCRALWITQQRGDPYPTLEKVEYLNNLMCLLVQRVEDPLKRDIVERGGRWKRIGVAIMKDAFPDDDRWSAMEDFAII